jgi:hypothetical protein
MYSLRKMLTGIGIEQEYVCVALEDLPDTLSAHVTSRNDSRSLDVTHRHVFLGYCPLILAIPYEPDEEFAACEAEICVNFVATDFVVDRRWQNFPVSRDSVARLRLSRIHENRLNGRRLVFYQGELGWHRLLGGFHRSTNYLLQRLKKRPAGNIALAGNLYDQVRIAYSIPRIISLVSVGDGTLLNLFPTDLHGPVGERSYLSSLRLGGKACEQVEQHRRIAISEMGAAAYAKVYRLGKNHMRGLAEATGFDLHSTVSANLGIPRCRPMLSVIGSWNGITTSKGAFTGSTATARSTRSRLHPSRPLRTSINATHSGETTPA